MYRISAHIEQHHLEAAEEDGVSVAAPVGQIPRCPDGID
jgi:hypothetical protein